MVVTVLLAAVAAGLLFGMRLVRARADAVPIPALSTMTDPRATGGGEPAAAGGASGDSRVSGSSAPGPPATDISSGGSASAGAMVRVHVVGQVKRPGVVEVPAGARILDAIEAAGGATSKADLDAINLARAVVDGEQIQVLRPGESPTPASGPAAPATGSGSGGTGGGPGVKVPINTADLAQLDTLPGVGPVLAQRILDWRSQHGAFASIDQLGEVSGIGEKLLANLTPLVTL
ncbi:putative DNA-binding protein [Nostocoides australiense Ben110]|uniref:Putative DNA-binding protein n=1 Tax=Nostocoides australiense Ben110 TaxID=1193182 RepID=W6JWF2_9MICO|nr:putative DNA-binding protein [Tetrasphaera australiensis Ben110]